MKRMKPEPPAYGVACMSAREILTANLTALMSVSKRLNSTLAIERATEENGEKVGHSTIDRAMKGKTNLSLDKIEAIARVFDLDPWQLLAPGLSPGNPPALKSVGAAEDDLYKKLSDLAKQITSLDIGGDK